MKRPLSFSTEKSELRMKSIKRSARVVHGRREAREGGGGNAQQGVLIAMQHVARVIPMLREPLHRPHMFELVQWTQSN